MDTPIAFARMQPFKKHGSGCMRDKLNYLGRKGRYAHRRDLVAGPCTALPPYAPKRFRDERLLWATAEDHERTGGLVALEFLVDLPSEAIMSKAEALAYCRELAETLVAEHGIAASFALHDGDEADDQGEPAINDCKMKQIFKCSKGDDVAIDMYLQTGIHNVTWAFVRRVKSTP